MLEHAKVLRLLGNLCLTKCCACHTICSQLRESVAPVTYSVPDLKKVNRVSRNQITARTKCCLVLRLRWLKCAPTLNPFRASPEPAPEVVCAFPENAKHAQGAHFEHFLSQSVARVTQSEHLSLVTSSLGLSFRLFFSLLFPWAVICFFHNRYPICTL